MLTVHIVMAFAAASLALVAVLGSQARRDHRLVIVIVCAALIIGHLASLLPAAPGWYPVLLVFASIAGFGWLSWTVSAGLAARRNAALPAGPPGPPGAAPRLRLIVSPAPSGPPAAGAGPVASITRDRPVPVVTREQLLQASPAGAAWTCGSTYVAASLGEFVSPGAGTALARAHRRTAAAGLPPAQRPARVTDPGRRLRAMRIRAAYAIGASPAAGTPGTGDAPGDGRGGRPRGQDGGNGPGC